jgi:hypothetical protein
MPPVQHHKKDFRPTWDFNVTEPVAGKYVLLS